VITDNIGSQEMKQNGDSDAAAAMSRVMGISVVDSMSSRGLGERQQYDARRFAPTTGRTKVIA
jgi:hypothetical protein